QRLAGASLFDAGLRWVLGATEVSLAIRNVFDTRYESLGFLVFDPARGGQVAMTYPGGGRFLRLGLSIGAGGR
ncbi:MAG: hypothetical protein ACYTG4_16720, partial [Planctomycetota bacterium]